jgi:prepilin-type N-terminal cleavage/methylation domain-containing protein/prepilin-type processing-associated H-X9-DG protein
MTCPRSRPPRGFTLVELLVAIAIIVILVGISFPYLTTSIARAKIAGCSSHLRAIGVGLLAFAGDNDGNFPEAGAVIPYDTVDPTTGKNGWMQQTDPYIQGRGSVIYQCPDSSHIVPCDSAYSYFIGAHAAYSQTQSFGAVNLLKMHDASAHILAGDVAFNMFTADDADKDDYGQDPAFNGNSGTIPIHLGSVNILFADGHVENVKKFDQTTMTTVYQGLNYPYLY